LRPAPAAPIHPMTTRHSPQRKAPPSRLLEGGGPGREISGQPGQMYPYFRKVYEKIVQEKDPGNDPQVARVARIYSSLSQTLG
jgi:hypothetical protein